MRVSVVHILFFCAFVVVVSCLDDEKKEKEYEEKKKKIIHRLKTVHTVLVDGYDLVTKAVVPNLSRFTSYQSVTSIFYPMPYEVTEARFIFESESIHLNHIGSCKVQDVIIVLKRGSYPAVNPDSYAFPKHYINPDHRGEPIHTIELKSDGVNQTYHVTHPEPGNWFALAYIKWTDPKYHAVQQDGLVADCYTVLYTDLQVKKKKDNISVIDCYSELTLKYSDAPGLYKCITTINPDAIQFNITIYDTNSSSKPLLVTLNALSLPTDKKYLVSCVFDPKANSAQTISFIPNLNSWHYIQISVLNGNTSKYADCESYISIFELESVENHTVISLMRDDKAKFFKYEYGLATTDMQDSTSLVDLSSGTVKSMMFNINEFIDIGGNMVIEMGLLMEAKYYGGYKRTLRKGAMYAFTEKDQFFKVVVCLSIDHWSLPLKTGRCQYNDRVLPALFVLNSTDSESIYDRVTIPYPESGTWYLTMRLFCDDVVCPCPASNNGTEYYVEPNVVKKDTISGENTRLGVTKCNSTAVLSISSDKCIHSECGKTGTCLLNAKTGMVLSYCFCWAGYGGWDCSDESRLESRAVILLSVLLLTLSNLSFIFTIYVSIIRRYYTEAVMYACTMVASALYHACDAHITAQMCFVDITILQYADFFCGNMAFWVTLLAMSVLPNSGRSSLYLVGSLLISLLTTWDRYSILTFVIPVLLGVVIVFISWGIDFKKRRVLRFPRSYYRRYFPFGLFLAMLGLLCYAKLQTEENYKYVHSFWHVIVAGCVPFLLPDYKRDGCTHPFLPSGKTCLLPNFRNIFKLPVNKE